MSRIVAGGAFLCMLEPDEIMSEMDQKMHMAPHEFDDQFDRGEDLSDQVDYRNFTKRVPFDLPLWAIEVIDKEAQRRGMTRQSLIKYWVTERADLLQKTRQEPA